MNVYRCTRCGREGWYGQDHYFDHFCWWTRVMRLFRLGPSGAGAPGRKP